MTRYSFKRDQQRSIRLRWRQIHARQGSGCLAFLRDGATGIAPISLAAERNVFASHAMSANPSLACSVAQAGALGKHFNSGGEGANSCAGPGINTKSLSRPAASQTPTILQPNPPLERPGAWLSPLVLRLNRGLTSSVCSVALRSPSG
jgi:hypothetical protein